MIALLVMTDGRADCIEQTIPAVLELVDGPLIRRVIHDDSADPDYRAWLHTKFPTFQVLASEHRLGFGGAIQHAWSHLRRVTDIEYVLHWEDDFVPNRVIDLRSMAFLLDRDHDLVQVALRRQAWNDTERAAGGIVEQRPDTYTDLTDGTVWWLEHRNFFTTNPCLYRRSLMERHWPAGSQSEGHFGVELFKNPKLRAAYWGRRTDPPAVTHIGVERVGVGY